MESLLAACCCCKSSVVAKADELHVADDSEKPPPTKEEEEEEEKVADLIASPPEKVAEEPMSKAQAYINSASLPPARDAFLDDQPDWKWEKERGQWKSYSLQESILLDQHWEVFSAAQPNGPYLAKVDLMKNKVTVDFKEMSTSVGSGRPRKIKREWKQADWLSNSYFFEAFTGALSAAGIKIDTSPQEMFDFRFVQDFRNVQNDGRKMYRGGKEYLLPAGWKRFAVNVKGQYDEGDNRWLRDDENGWAVAYHGTSPEGLPGILSTGFRIGERQKFADDTGSGIYCAPEISVAQHYSKPRMVKGRGVQIVLQLRVRPEAIRPVSDPKAHDFEKKYWVINNPAEIRAYGVLIRELRMKDYIYPEFMVYGRDNPALKNLKQQYADELRQEETAYGR